jgi:hypothetical protein
MAAMTDQLGWLQQWYADRCNGDWEHLYGVTIGTLDNPGWSLDIDLAETILSDLVVKRVFTERSENDWISYEVTSAKFLGRGGPLALNELIEVFRRVWESSARS